MFVIPEPMVDGDRNKRATEMIGYLRIISVAVVDVCVIGYLFLFLFLLLLLGVQGLAGRSTVTQTQHERNVQKRSCAVLNVLQ